MRLPKNPNAPRNCDLYKVWYEMHRRCYSPKNERFISYGARGITVCSEWTDSPTNDGYEKFQIWAINSGYRYVWTRDGKNGLSIDRKDVNLGYSPENCKWSDVYTQNQNRRVS